MVNVTKYSLLPKIAGPGFGGTHIREGHTKFNSEHISQAIDGSLKRLQTDYIDLYQLHWPERHTNFLARSLMVISRPTIITTLRL